MKVGASLTIWGQNKLTCSGSIVTSHAQENRRRSGHKRSAWWFFVLTGKASFGSISSTRGQWILLNTSRLWGGWERLCAKRDLHCGGRRTSSFSRIMQDHTSQMTQWNIFSLWTWTCGVTPPTVQISVLVTFLHFLRWRKPSEDTVFKPWKTSKLLSDDHSWTYPKPTLNTVSNNLLSSTNAVWMLLGITLRDKDTELLLTKTKLTTNCSRPNPEDKSGLTMDTDDWICAVELLCWEPQGHVDKSKFFEQMLIVLIYFGCNKIWTTLMCEQISKMFIPTSYVNVTIATRRKKLRQTSYGALVWTILHETQLRQLVPMHVDCLHDIWEIFFAIIWAILRIYDANMVSLSSLLQLVSCGSWLNLFLRSCQLRK